MIIASSDMTHYEEHQAVIRKDNMAIEAILELDEGELLERIRNNNISMCGPAGCQLDFPPPELAGKANCRMHRTSGDTSGDYDSVVGYAGIIIKKRG